MAIVSTPDATFVAPVSRSQNVKKIVEQLEKSGRLETKFTPAHDRAIVNGAWRGGSITGCLRKRCRYGRPQASTTRMAASTRRLGFDGRPLKKPKRMRTMARQIYAFAVAKERGWDGPADRLIEHGIAFIASNGRTDRGGWVRTLNVDGSVADPTEDAYDHSCVLLALAHAHRAGHKDALKLGEETFHFLDAHLEDARLTGFLETPDGVGLRRSNPHMHLLEVVSRLAHA